VWGGLSVSTPVPLSGFLNLSAVFSRPEPCGLVSCHNRSWDPPFRAFPLQRSRASLEVAGSPAVIHRRAEVRRASPFAGWFHRLPRCWAQLPGFPSGYGLRFPRPRSGSPSSRALLGGVTSFRQLHLLRSFVPLARPCQPLQVAPRQLVVSLLGFVPFEALLLPRLGFSTRRGLVDLDALLRPRTPVCDSRDRSPWCQVRPSYARVPRKISSTDSSPLRTGPRRLSTATLLSWPWWSGKPDVLTFRASKCVESERFSEKIRLLPWGSLPPHQPRDFGVLSDPGFSPRGFTELLDLRLRRPAGPLDPRSPLLTGHVAAVSA